MNNDNTQQEKQQAPVVTFSNIPLDETPAPAGLDTLPPEAVSPTVTVADIQFKPGGKVYYKMSPWRMGVVAADVVIGLGTLWGILSMIRRAKDEKKKSGYLYTENFLDLEELAKEAVRQPPFLCPRHVSP